MCRARPGPRCSNSARIRRDRARKALQRVQMQAAQYRRDNPTDDGSPVELPDKLATKMENAELRMEQANRVWYATPKGQEELAHKIAGLERELAKMPTEDEISSPREKKIRQEQVARIAASKKMLEQGVERRMNSYADLHDFIEERPKTRQEAINRGADLTPRAQKNLGDKDYTTGEPQSLKLEPYTPEQLERASSWVETGADSGWHKGGTFKPPRSINGVELGEKADEPVSRVVRLSTPDGAVVEARHDVHVTKTKDGTYIVSRRATTAASFEDASPIDKNTQPLGHLLKNTHGIDRTEILGEYKSLHAARVRRGMIVNNSSNLPDSEKVDFVAHSAEDGRDLMISRFGNKNKKDDVMNRGFVVERHRYETTLDEDDARNTYYKQDVKKQRKMEKMLEKARASAGTKKEEATVGSK